MLHKQKNLFFVLYPPRMILSIVDCNRKVCCPIFKVHALTRKNTSFPMFLIFKDVCILQNILILLLPPSEYLKMARRQCPFKNNSSEINAKQNNINKQNCEDDKLSYDYYMTKYVIKSIYLFVNDSNKVHLLIT